MASLLTDRIRHDVLIGALKPGSRLTMKDLAQRYDAGTIPLREALSRLSSAGFITIEDQRGFRVAEMSIEEVLDIQRLRAELESIALRKSIELGTLDWEIELTSSYHALMHVQSRLEGRPLAVNADWEERHNHFHLQLVSACDSKWMLRFIKSLIEHSSRYRQAASVDLGAKASARDPSAEHKAIFEAAIRRDADLACALLRSHYRMTADYVVGMLAAANPAEPKSARQRENP